MPRLDRRVPDPGRIPVIVTLWQGFSGTGGPHNRLTDALLPATSPPMRPLLVLALLAGCAHAARPPNVSEADVDLSVPRASEFVFGPGDVLRVFVWRHEDLTMDITIAPDGAISYPLVGRLQVSGMTLEQIRLTLQNAVAQYYVDAQVTVNIMTVNSAHAMVFGEVRSPSVLSLSQDMTMLEALVRTGGINPDARTDNVLLIRGCTAKHDLYLVDVAALYGRGDFTQNVYLQPCDIVVVPPKTITNVERFFKRISSVLSPAVSASAIYRNVTTGDGQVLPNQ
jgi:polysaccharide export outer membrane protein